MRLRSPFRGGRAVPTILVLLALLLLPLLSACGTDQGPGTAERRLAQARETFLSAASVRLTGQVTQDGKRLDLDVWLVGNRGGRGTITVAGVRFEVIRIGELLWFKAPRSFYLHRPELPVELLAGRWLEASAAIGQFARFATFTRPDQIADRLLSTTAELNARSTTFAGSAAVALTTPNGTLVVTKNEPVRPLRALGAAGSGNVLLFSAYGEPVELRRPDQVVTASQVAAAQANQVP